MIRRLPPEMLWALTGVLLSKVFPLAAGILLVRIFGAGVYGEYSLALTTVNLLLAATGVGMSGGLIARLSKLGAEARHQLAASFFALNIALLAVTVGVALGASLLGLVDRRLSVLAVQQWQVMLPLVLVQIVLAAQIAVATASGRLKAFAGASLVAGVLTSALQLLGGWQWNVAGALWGLFGGYLIQSLIQGSALGAARLRWSLTGLEGVTATVRNAWLDFLTYGKYMYGSSVLVSFGMWFLSYSLLNAGMNEVGAFAVLNHWKMLIMFAPLALSNYLSSRFSTASSDSARLRVLKRSVAGSSVLLFASFLISMSLPQHILGIYGRAYTDMKAELMLISFVAFLASINSIFGNFLTGVGWFKQGFLSNVVWFLTVLAATAATTGSGFLAIDACVALAAAYITHSAYQVILLRQYCRKLEPRS